MITLDHLSKTLGSKLLFHDACMSLQKGRRYGITGANGCGKSTFLKVVSGEEETTDGTVHTQKNATIGFLKQDHYAYESSPLTEVVIRGKPVLWDALQKKEILLEKEDWTNEDILKLETLEETISLYHGYEAEANASSLLSGLGIEEKQHSLPMKVLSGGYKVRVLLAQTLFSSPDILLLDEPTNYLDIVSISWLEQFLKLDFEGLLLIVSHDRKFLNTISTDILDIDYGIITPYTGNYEKFLEKKKQTHELQSKAKKDLEKKIAQMRAFVERFRYKPSKSRQAMSREKMIDKIEVPEILSTSRRAPGFAFTQKRASGKTVLTVKNLSKTYETRTLFQSVDFSIYRGDKVVIIGPNGIGKSTLLKTLLTPSAATTGEVEWGFETHLSYLPQDASIHESDALSNWLSNRHSVAKEPQIRNALGQMLFSGDDVYKTIPVLSGGETVRLLFADIMLQQGNVLILDEPTNHLDLESADSLGKALTKFDGTVILVTHDRYLIEEIATRVIYISHEKLINYEGSYKDFLASHNI